MSYSKIHGYNIARRDGRFFVLEVACRLGMDDAHDHGGDVVQFHTPLMYMTKAETWMFARDLQAVDYIRTRTHTCYEGDHDTMNPWGFGCGECPACEIRAEGWREFQQMTS